MLCVKIMSDETMIGLEAIDSPVYVMLQKNNVVVRCLEPMAQGIVSLDGSEIYQLDGKTSLGDGYSLAVPITLAEYDELAANYEDTTDPEDTNPEVPEGTEEGDVLTRAELTAKVAELEEQLAATKILLGVE